MGTNTKAGMKYSVAIGSDARTVNTDGTVTGGTNSSGAIAIGYQASATNNEAIAIGGGTKGNGYAIASGAQSIALGGRTQTSGSQSIGIGGDVKVYGNVSIGIGGDDIEDALNATVTTSDGTSMKLSVALAGLGRTNIAKWGGYTTTTSGAHGSIFIGNNAYAQKQAP